MHSSKLAWQPPNHLCMVSYSLAGVQLQQGQVVAEALQAWCEANAQAIKRCKGLLHGEACATTLVSFFCQPEGARQNPGCLVPKVSGPRFSSTLLGHVHV